MAKLEKMAVVKSNTAIVTMMMAMLMRSSVVHDGDGLNVVLVNCDDFGCIEGDED